MKRAVCMGATLLALIGARVARADVLYWMFETTDVAENVGAYAYASVVAVKGDVTHYLNWSDSDQVARLGAGEEGGGVWLDVSGYDASWSFMVEVWNYGILNKDPNAGNQLYLAGGSALSKFADLQNAGYIYSAPTSVQDAAWHPLSVIPEPSSGLLTLLGFSFLALRRKRRAPTAGVRD